MYVLTVAECIKALVIYYQEPVLDMDRLDTLLELAHILAISRHIHRVFHLQLLSHFSRCISHTSHLCISNRGRLSIWANSDKVQEADTGVDRVAEDSHNLLVLSMLAVDRQGYSL